MKIDADPGVGNPSQWIEVVNRLWLNHPLLSKSIESASSILFLLIIPGEEYVTDWGGYPNIKMKIKSTDYPSDPAPISHELTHIIDRHDIKFTGGASPVEITKLIENLPLGKNESVRTAFKIMWDTYIDGRLFRRGIFVYTLNERFNELLSSRKDRIAIDPEEYQAMQDIWNIEPKSFDDLVKAATKFPVKRPPDLRV